MPEMNQEFLKKLMSGQYNAQSESTPAASETNTETPPPATPVPTPIIGQDASLEQLPISCLTDFPDNPVPPYTDDGLAELMESIRTNGVIEPLIVRPFGDGWQIINGRNRRNAAQRIGYSTVPCIVKKMSDDDAAIQLVDTIFNQRDVSKLSLMQKARAYRIRAEASNRQGRRTDLTLDRVGPMLNKQIIGSAANDSQTQIKRFIRLTYLIPEFQEEVDREMSAFSFTAAVLISFLSENNQTTAYRFFLDENDYGISIKLAELLKEKEHSGIVFDDELLAGLWDSLKGQSQEDIDTEECDGEEPEDVVFKYKKFKEYLPPRCSTEKMEQIIVKALKLYNRIERRKGSKR